MRPPERREGSPLPAREHLSAGGLGVSVPADEEQKATAARVLGAHGAGRMAHFDQPLGTLGS